MMELENGPVNQGKTEKSGGTKLEKIIRLERLQKEIPRARGKDRDKAIAAYRELLKLLKDEPTYLLRY